MGPTKAATIFGVKRWVAKYWKQKIDDPFFHPGPWGGFRALKFGNVGDKLVQHILWVQVQQHPSWNIPHHVGALTAAGVDVNCGFVARIFQSWGWSWHKPTHTQIRKYTPANVEYYSVWIVLILSIPWIRLKFLDEAHFVSRDLYHRRVIGPRGYKLFVVETAELNLSYSLTLLTDLSTPTNPFFISLRSESNTEWDFLNFVVDAVQANRLVQGDILVVDNAAVHFGGETWELLTTLLDGYGISYVFLPTYSPELNPCELVFAFVKNFIRNNREPDIPLYQLMLVAFVCLPYTTLLSFYNHCTQILFRMT